jgi:hypothetical protein
MIFTNCTTLAHHICLRRCRAALGHQHAIVVTMFGCFVTVTSGRKVIDFHVEPPERGSWSCWRAGKLCASCIVVEAEKAKVRHSLVNVIGTSWSDQPPPRNPYKRKR